jgi:hypothetical protein
MATATIEKVSNGYIITTDTPGWGTYAYVHNNLRATLSTLARHFGAGWRVQVVIAKDKDEAASIEEARGQAQEDGGGD